MTMDHSSDQALMPQDLVRTLFLEVQTKMVAHIAPSLCELYYPSVSSSGVLENGTGAFVNVGGTNLLVSNDHVIGKRGLHHSFYGYDRFVHAARQRYGLGAPTDIGAAKIAGDDWAQLRNSAVAIPFERLASSHQTVPFEILWTAGYPGVRVKQLADMTLSVCQALPTQEYVFSDGEEPHEAFDPTYHFALGYSPDKAQLFDDSRPWSSPGLSDPHGLSGSLVWNTRRLECYYSNQAWDMSKAVVTGIVWGWPTSNYLIATKVEHFRSFLLEASILSSTPTW